MSYPINYPTPQGANVQIFTANTNDSADGFSADWVKPQGASMVWFTLIGAGGGGGNATSDGSGGNAYAGGGGSGAVTTCMVPAFLIPDQLIIRVYDGDDSTGNDTTVGYRQKASGTYILLRAQGGDAGGLANSVGGATVAGAGGAGGTIEDSNEFSAAGFFQSVAGQNGTNGNVNQTTSTTTFLQGGPGGSAVGAASQYGYSRASLTTAAQMGYGILSPILVSVASTEADNTYTTAAAALVSRNGFGCGGGGAFTTTVSTTRYGTRGGDGLVVIVTW
jgi:hypothetical protein